MAQVRSVRLKVEVDKEKLHELELAEDHFREAAAEMRKATDEVLTAMKALQDSLNVRQVREDAEE